MNDEYAPEQGVPNPAIKQMRDLLRVARAARILEAEYDYFNNDLPGVWDELTEALKEVEHQLDA